MKVYHLALESKTDSNKILWILLLLCLNGIACLPEYMYIEIESYLYETIYWLLKYLPVITLCMPVDNFVICQ